MLEAINRKELNLIQVLSMALTLFGQNIRWVLIIVVILFFPISILNVLIMEKLNQSAQALVDLGKSGVLNNMPIYMDALLGFFKMHMLQLVVFLFLEPVGVISVGKIVKNGIVKEEASLSQVLGEAMNCLGIVVLTGIPYLVLFMLGSFLFVLPGIYLAFIWIFYVYGIGLSEKRGWSALEYSRALVKGRFWKTVGYVLVIFIIAASWNWMLSGIYFLLPEHVATDILYNTLSYIVSSFSFMAMTILFLNREAVVLGKYHFSMENVVADV